MTTINYFGPSFEHLPIEIIQHILGYLNPSDILEASLTCHRWFAASQHPQFTSKYHIVLKKIQLNDLNDFHSPLIVFNNSLRNYTAIRLDEVDFGTTIDTFWERFGDQFTEIIFNTCDLREKSFNTILKNLTNLRTLEINNCRELFMSGRLFKSVHDREAIGEACHDVRNISLCNNRYLSDALFNRIVSAMHHIESLNLSGCHISFHKGLYRKFYPDYQNDASESVLTFYYILQFIQHQSEYIKCLNFSTTLIDGSALDQLADIKNLNLKILHLRSCDQLTNSGLISFVQRQNNLIELDLSVSVRLTDPVLIEICKSLKNLQILKLRRCRAITDIGVREIFQLKMLKILDLSECNAITSDGFVNGIVKEKNNYLIELHVSALNICELAVIRIAENLKNLILLDLSFCKNAVTDLAVQLIFQNLSKIRTLNLEFCDKISDAGITGMEMHSEMMKYENNKNNQINVVAGADEERLNDVNGIEIGEDVLDQPLPHRLNDGNELNQQNVIRIHSYSISLRSKAEQDIVNDAKRKRVMLEMCKLSEAKEEVNCSGYMIGRLSGLKSLNLSSCNRITDVSLKYAFEFIELRELKLSKCQQVTSIGIDSVTHKCPSLEIIDLSECHNINDKAIDILTKNLKRLTHLHIERCSQLTDHSLDSIAINCKCIKYLDIRGCRGMCSEPNIRLEHIRSLQRIIMSKPGPYVQRSGYLPIDFECKIKIPKAPPMPPF